MAVPFPFDAWARPGKDAFEFWISFFPTAPLFGVEWRFAGMMDPALSPFMQAGAMAFPMPFPDARAAGAAARPGELDTPALADEGAARPLARTAEAAAAVTGDAGRVAAGTGKAAMHTAAAAVKAGGEAAAEVTADAVRTAGRAAGAPAATQAVTAEGAPRAEQEAEEKAEARLATGQAAETAVDEVRPARASAQTNEDLFDAAIAAAPRPDVLLTERPENPDDLRTLKGIGAALEKQLNELGVWRFEQIARMTDADLAWIDAHLSTVPGRCFRDDWVGQAKARLGK
jgi:NADH-quinone oxidoreductase subunit E